MTVIQSSLLLLITHACIDSRSTNIAFFEVFYLILHQGNISGMAPMKPYFKGEVEPPRRRVCTCQKCIRTGDIENIGKTARHGTYFEMLGNFSFGDYFKKEAIHWSWEFLTSPEWVGLDPARLYPSVFEGNETTPADDEAFRIWNEEIGVPADHIFRFGKADNFWEHGSGPCGPCSEIYYDRGEKYGCGSPNCTVGCDCDRYIEVWNNVFSQFNSDGEGHYEELKQKNIDTGMGLERLACVMQSVDNMFEVDSIRKLLDTVCTIAGKTYGNDKDNDISIRVCTDHTKSSMFMIADGVIPSNEGRGYVLRRIIRRACRHGKLLGINHPFLTDLCKVAIGENKDAYPELAEKQDYILKVLSLEEERFDATIDAGLSILNGIIEDAVKNGKSAVSGEDAFKLYDTFGFPLDLTKEILAEKTKVVYKDKVEYVYVDVEKTDTMYIEEKVYVQMPRQYYLTETDDVRIWHSGIDSTIDSLNLVRKTQNITETIQKKDKKNYLSVGAEAMYIGTPYIPIYVEYERMLHRNFSIYARAMHDFISQENGVIVGVEAQIGW